MACISLAIWLTEKRTIKKQETMCIYRKDTYPDKRKTTVKLNS